MTKKTCFVVLFLTGGRTKHVDAWDANRMESIETWKMKSAVSHVAFNVLKPFIVAGKKKLCF